jgi:hypothetical protein
VRNRPAAILSLATVVGVGLLIGESFEPNAGRSLPPLSRTPAAAAIDDAGSLSPTARLRRQLAAERAEHRAKLAKVVRLNRRHRAEARRYRRTLKTSPTIDRAIRLAAFTHGVPVSTMRRIAFCESRFNPHAKNSSSTASGLFQFLDTTWAGNRYGKAGFSVWSPFANAMGAAYHMSRYGTGAWECR